MHIFIEFIKSFFLAILACEDLREVREVAFNKIKSLGSLEDEYDGWLARRLNEERTSAKFYAVNDILAEMRREAWGNTVTLEVNPGTKKARLMTPYMVAFGFSNWDYADEREEYTINEEYETIIKAHAKRDDFGKELLAAAHKIAAIKTTRTYIPSFGLKEAKDFVEEVLDWTNDGREVARVPVEVLQQAIRNWAKDAQ
jgi:hypothetical protein